jgi:hypothetical protein
MTDITTRDTCIRRLDPDVYDALEAKLGPGEKVIDLANYLLREALKLSDPPERA